MKKVKNILMMGAFAAVLTSCSASWPIAVTDNSAGVKRGEAKVKVILGFIRPMDADLSIKTAAKNGGITKVATVDQKVKSGLFVTTYYTIVTGE